jgi:hypothetical protein
LFINRTVGFPREQPVHHNCPGLADAVRARLGLQVVLRIPVTAPKTRNKKQETRNKKKTLHKNK